MASNTDGVRLKSWREQSGLSQRDLASLLGRSQGFVGNIEAGRTGLSRDLIARLIENTTVNVSWLLTGVGPMDRALSPTELAGEKREGAFQGRLSQTQVSPPDRSRPLTGDFQVNGEEFALVRRFDIGISAGPGLVPLENAEVDYLAFSRRWLLDKGLSADLCALVRVRGDSMAPTIPDGAMVLVNAAEMQVAREGIYAFSRDGEAYIKRIMPVGGDDSGRPDILVIISDNPTGKSETVTGPDLLDIRVVGRIRCVITSY